MISSTLIKGLVWHPMDDIEDHHLLDSKAMHVSGSFSPSFSFLHRRNKLRLGGATLDDRM
jgi:hypothetical protein